MDLTLVIMAAGLGSRYGGTKQLEEVGAKGETFFDFAIADAVAAGVTRVVMIVRSDIRPEVEAQIGRVHGDRVDVAFIEQDTFGPPRDKPWGTGHAILSAADHLDGTFLVINADDYYGQASYGLLCDAARAAGPSEGVMISFELARALPVDGEVTRGICRVDDGVLLGIDETPKVHRTPDGGFAGGEPPEPLAADTPVSLNMWAFPSLVVDALRSGWAEFHAVNGDDPKAEFLLPDVIDTLMTDGRMRINVVPCAEDWVGITNPGDLEIARHALANRN